MAKTRIVIPYRPHRGQLLLHNDPHRYKTIVCGRRFGKTIYAVNELLKCSLKTGGKYWYIAPSFKQAKLIAWEMLKYYAVAELRKDKNESDLFIKLVNNGEIRLMGADNPDSLRGVGLMGAVLDEYADIKREVWTKIVRPMLTISKGWATFIGTPKGKSNHLYEQYIKDAKYNDLAYRTIDNRMISADPDYASFSFKTEENPYADKEEIEKARAELAPQYFRQEYEASFEDYTGLIYKEFDVLTHCVEMKQGFISDWWNIYIGIDTGRYTAVSFIAVDDRGVAHIFDEVYNHDGRVAEIVQQIKYKLNQWGISLSRCQFRIDPASQVKREYKGKGIPVADAKKDVENQISHIRTRFSSNTLFINKDNCPMHITEHKGYTWNEKSARVEPVKEHDHTCNSTQYGLSKYMAKARDRNKEERIRQTLYYRNVHPHDDADTANQIS